MRQRLTLLTTGRKISKARNLSLKGVFKYYLQFKSVSYVYSRLKGAFYRMILLYPVPRMGWVI